MNHLQYMLVALSNLFLCYIFFGDKSSHDSEARRKVRELELEVSQLKKRVNDLAGHNWSDSQNYWGDWPDSIPYQEF